jgi:hypothetical protein
MANNRYRQCKYCKRIIPLDYDLKDHKDHCKALPVEVRKIHGAKIK